MAVRLAITLGDVAGIGPEVAVKAWPALLEHGVPTVIGDAATLRATAQRLGAMVDVVAVDAPVDVAEPGRIACLDVPTAGALASLALGRVHAEAGKAAYDFLIRAIALALEGQADAIVTLPLHKEGLRLAGVTHPGHTEILAERTGTRDFGMMLYARGPLVPHGVGVVHVTLHMALRDVFANIDAAGVGEKIGLVDGVMRRLHGRAPRVAVAALNPHAGDGGLFGDEETRILAPAIAAARARGIDVTGPLPSDTLFVRAQRGEFDGVVAMYHDQGHIPLKLLSGLRAVNVSLGLPIVRTSVAHGTAYDIAGQGVADPQSLVEAARVAALLAANRK